MKPQVQIIALGGTIACTPDSAGSGVAPGLTGADLVAAVPQLGALADVEARNLSNVPSTEIGLPLVIELAKRVEVGLYSIDIFYDQQPAKNGLYFGFGAIETLDIDIALDRLRDILQQVA